VPGYLKQSLNGGGSILPFPLAHAQVVDHHKNMKQIASKMYFLPLMMEQMFHHD